MTDKHPVIMPQKDNQTNKKAHILVVDDELSMREFLDLMLSKEGYQVSLADSGARAIEMIKSARYDLYVLDIRLGDMSGIDVLRAAKDRYPDAVAIMISAYSTTEAAVEAMNCGAYDYVPKPFDNTELRQTIANALDRKTLESDKKILDDELKEQLHFGKLVGNSPGMMKIYTMIRQVAATKTSVLISGESGTGKEFIAKAIHEQSDRRDQPFITVNCGGIPETLMESELFGHQRGAFTGATQDKPGLFELAHKGTIFLDEIGELGLALQVKLLRAVQERVFKRVGGTRDISVDIRIISATNKTLEDEVIAGRFREDLFYRLNVIEIKVPPLRQRKADLKILAQYFLEKYAKEMNKDVTKISSYAIDLLKKYDFPGNVRELENLIERSVALSTTNIILPESLSIAVHKRRWIEGVPNRRFDLDDVAHGVNLDEILQEIEAAYIRKGMELANGNKNRAAELLGITFRSMRYRFDKLDDANGKD